MSKHITPFFNLSKFGTSWSLLYPFRTPVPFGEQTTQIIFNSLHAKKLSGERFQPFIIIRQDENNPTSKIRNPNRNLKYEKERERKNEKQAKIRKENTQEHAKVFTDFQRGVLSREIYAVFQLLEQTRPTTTNGYEYTHSWINTPTPFLGRPITICICTRTSWRRCALNSQLGGSGNLFRYPMLQAGYCLQFERPAVWK